MSGEWKLKIEAESDKPGSYTVHLGLQDARSGQVVELATPCKSVESFQQEIAQLTEELQQLVEEARRQVESLVRTEASAPKQSPDKIWKQMEGFATEAEMFEFFNSFDEQQRQQVAEYIFSNVNMFKGRGPVFSEHYDAASHVLE